MRSQRSLAVGSGICLVMLSRTGRCLFVMSSSVLTFWPQACHRRVTRRLSQHSHLLSLLRRQVTSLPPAPPGEGNGSPLQCSCLENPRDGGAWWAAVYGVTQSRARLKRLSSSSSTTWEAHTAGYIVLNKRKK